MHPCAQLTMMLGINIYLIWPFGILITTWLRQGRLRSVAMAVVCLVGIVELVSVVLTQAIQEAPCVTNAAWSSLALYSSKQCMDSIYQQRLAIINAFTTGTSAFLNYCYAKVKSARATCSLLLSGFAMARTQSSAKTRSARYSDL